MKNKIPWSLLESYFANSGKEQTKSEVDKWIVDSPENIIIYNQLKKYFAETGSLPTHFNPNIKNAKNLFSERTGKSLSHHSIPFINSYWMKIAASIIVIAVCSWLLTRSLQQDIKWTTIASTNMEQTEVTLSDGSKIWLNSGSRFTYPSRFNKKREVYLNGEGYFEIAHDTQHPFIVHTANTQTQVLGTKFNIRNDKALQIISVSVTEGKVKFGYGISNPLILIKGTQGVYNVHKHTLTYVDKIDCNVLSWKTKNFDFEDIPLPIVLNKLAEIYQFKYKLTNNSLSKIKITAKFNNRPLKEIIQSLALSANINISIDKNVCTVSHY